MLHLWHSAGRCCHPWLLRPLSLQKVRPPGSHQRVQEMWHRLRTLQHRPHGRGVQHQALHPGLRTDEQVLGEGEAGGAAAERGKQIVPKRGRGGKSREIFESLPSEQGRPSDNQQPVSRLLQGWEARGCFGRRRADDCSETRLGEGILQERDGSRLFGKHGGGAHLVLPVPCTRRELFKSS